VCIVSYVGSEVVPVSFWGRQASDGRLGESMSAKCKDDWDMVRGYVPGRFDVSIIKADVFRTKKSRRSG